MRALYVIVGLLIGIYVASNAGIAVANDIMRQNDKELLAATLTGMCEGWERGRDWTIRKTIWEVMRCQDELRRYRGKR